MLLTTPELTPIVATLVVLLLHVPPVVASCTVTVEPGHIGVFPVIAAGSAITVTVAVVRHPVLAV
jgi:hypothetical protein